MSPIKGIGLLAVVGVLTPSVAGMADTTLEEQNAELKARLARLEERLANVEAQEGEDWLTEQRAAEIRGLVQDVLADADTRSSMMAQGMTAGYDNGAVIGSADGNWLLRTNLLLQTRFVFNTQSNSPAGDPTVWGFEVTRARFDLSGHVVDPTWFYKLSIQTSTNGAGRAVGAPVPSLDARTGLLDAYVGKDFGNGWKVWGGQYKAPLLYGELVDDAYQQMVDRSYLTWLYTGGYTQGVVFEWASDQFRAYGSYNNGINDTQYTGGVVTSPGAGGTQAAALATDTKWAVTGRIEWLASGNWDQFKDYTSPQGEDMGIMVGGAIHVQDAEDQITTTTAGNAVQLFVGTVDVSAEFGGANAYGALIFANADVTGAASSSPWGFEFGGGWYFQETWELYANYQWSDLDQAGLADLSLFTIGVNKYMSGQNLKWSTDVAFGLDQIPFTIPATGLRADSVNEDGQFVLRSQFQMLF